MQSHVQHTKLMPIPAVAEHTQYFAAGPIAIGVEYRLLNDAIVGRHVESEKSDVNIPAGQNDRGVSLHVFGTDDGSGGARQQELLRFDCFDEDPHYHYVDWNKRSNDIVHIDPIANGDSLLWALERIRTRLPQMLERAGAPEVASRIDLAALDAIMPRVSEAAYRARYEHDDEATLRSALGAD